MSLRCLFDHRDHDGLVQALERVSRSLCREPRRRNVSTQGKNAVSGNNPLSFNPGYVGYLCVAVLKKPVDVTLETLSYFGEGRPYADDSSVHPWTGQIIVDLTTWNGAYVPKEGWSSEGHTYCQRDVSELSVYCRPTGAYDAGN